MAHNLKPGESMIDTVEVNDLYDLSLPGQYTIEVERRNIGSQSLVKSNSVVVTITR
jgi:hypothetical protein